MVASEWVIGRVREELPQRLQPLWRIGLALIFGLGVLILLIVQPETVPQYVRAAQWPLAVYIILLSARIIQVTWELRIRGSTVSYALPLHIGVLALSTIMAVVLLDLPGILRFDQPPIIPAYPWLVVVQHLLVIIGLNYIWQVQVARSAHDAQTR